MLKHYLVSGSQCPIRIYNVINCSDGAAAPKGLTTYGTTQRKSESDMPATESERLARSERLVIRFKSLGKKRYVLSGVWGFE